MTHVSEIEGVGDSHTEKLSSAGLASVESLLAEGGTAGGRSGIAGRTGISEKLILKW